MITPYYDNDGITLYQGDCLDVMPQLAPQSVDLILTDPPYYRVKNEAWDRQWDNANLFIEWVGRLCVEWKRVLKPNGSLYMFASPQMSARVELKIGEHFNVLNNIRWYKEQGWHKKADADILRSYLTPWEACIFAEQFGSDEYAANDGGYFLFEPLRAYLDNERRDAGISFDAVRKMVGCADGSGLPSHWFTKSQWILPTAEQYQKLQSGFGGAYLLREYENLRSEYENLRRRFTMNHIREDRWNFDTVAPYTGKHPCEKPQALLSHIITTSTKSGATVLDCFAGSGSTLLAAKLEGRKCIGIERDTGRDGECLGYCEYAVSRLAQSCMVFA